MFTAVRSFLIVVALLAAAPGLLCAAEIPHANGNVDAHGAEHAAGSHIEEYTIWGDLPFWSLIAFLGFVYAIKKLGLWDHMLTSMANREKAEIEAISIAENDLSSAQALLRHARGRLEAMDQTVRDLIAEGERDAKSTTSDILQLAEKEARASLERTRFEIDRVRHQTLNDLFDSLADKVAAATQARLQQELNPDDQRRLIDQTLEQLAIR